MIKFENVNFCYQKEKPLYENFNATFDNGVVNVLMGNSGVGKSTLLSLAMKMLSPQQGSVTCGSCACVFQQSRLVEELSVYDNIDIVLRSCIKDKKQRRQTILDGLESVGMDSYKDTFPAYLSGGQRQRVALLRAFLYPSEVILLDEPFKGLDSNIKQQLCRTFADMLGGNLDKTVLFVTHDVEVAMAVGDKIFVLEGNPLEVKLLANVTVQRVERDLYSDSFNDLRKQLNTALQCNG